MDAVLTMVGALLFPLCALGLVFAMSHLEQTLPRDVARARRRAAPAPILAMPVHDTPAQTEELAPVTVLAVERTEVPDQRRSLVERPAS